MIDMYILITYASRVGTMLKNFKQKKARLWEFSHSCEKQHGNKSLKKRGYIYETTDGKSLNVKCQHCGYSKSLGNFIRDISPSLYDEFRIESYRGNIENVKPLETAKIEVAPKTTTIAGLIPVVTLPPSSSILKFLERRQIPKEKYPLLYVAKHFFKWAAQFNSEFEKVTDASPRLVLPYFDVSGRVFGFTARSFNPSAVPRYIHIRVDKSQEFIYGASRIDYKKPIYVTEGHIDSFFVDNAVAVGGAHYDTPFINSIKEQAVLIPDSDWKRNKQVGNQLKKAITRGYKVCFIPDTVKGKDLNEIVQNGVSTVQLKDIIERSTKGGLEAMLEFALLKKY